MSHPVPDARLEEASVITKVIENHLRKLIRFLIGRVSLVKLQEMIRFIFIEEIENKLRNENPNKNISLTQIALLSGLDTRTLTKIRNSANYRKPFCEEANFLKEAAPGASILDVWSSKDPYFDEATGQPKVLDISGSSESFESLFMEAIKSRGVTYKSLLERLNESGAVSIDVTQEKVQLINNSYLPTDSKDKLGAIEMGFTAMSNLADTVTKNIASLESNSERLFQRGAWTYRLSRKNQSEMRTELNSLLESTDKKARSIIEKFEDSSNSPDQFTAGVSFFYFEETDPRKH
jgi:hypothetical protein